MTLEGYPKMEENPQNIYVERLRLQKSCWLVRVINTATGGEALILSMYSNYFDGTVCIGESVLHFEKTSKFNGYNFQLKTRPMLCYLAGYCSALTNMALHSIFSIYHKTELCIII